MQFDVRVHCTVYRQETINQEKISIQNLSDFHSTIFIWYIYSFVRANKPTVWKFKIVLECSLYNNECVIYFYQSKIDDFLCLITFTCQLSHFTQSVCQLYWNAIWKNIHFMYFNRGTIFLRILELLIITRSN